MCRLVIFTRNMTSLGVLKVCESISFHSRLSMRQWIILRCPITPFFYVVWIILTRKSVLQPSCWQLIETFGFLCCLPKGAPNWVLKRGVTLFDNSATTTGKFNRVLIATIMWCASYPRTAAVLVSVWVFVRLTIVVFIVIVGQSCKMDWFENWCAFLLIGRRVLVWRGIVSTVWGCVHQTICFRFHTSRYRCRIEIKLLILGHSVDRRWDLVTRTSRLHYHRLHRCSWVVFTWPVSPHCIVIIQLLKAILIVVILLLLLLIIDIKHGTRVAESHPQRLFLLPSLSYLLTL